MNLKQILRDNLPRHQIERLKALKEKFGLTSFVVRALAMMPVSVAVGVKERIQRTGKLDYRRGDISMNLDSRIQISRLYACKKEPETVQWIETHVKPGDVFYDIGANVGAYSFVACMASGGTGTVYAFEPSFSTFSALSQNVLLNGCTGKIVPLHVALACQTTLLDFLYHQVVPGASTHKLTNAASEHDRNFRSVFTQPILCFRLDDLVRQFALRLPNHIKLDVDGGELDILRSAEEILEQPTLRSILVEVDEELYPSEEIPKLLEAKKFRVQSRHQRGQHKTIANYIFER